MRIRSAVGLVVAVVALKFLMGSVFSGLEETLVEFLDMSQAVFQASQESLEGRHTPPPRW